MLYKLRDFVIAGILKQFYHDVFESHVHYACIIWGQNICTINCLFILPKKALRFIHFTERNGHTARLFSNQKWWNFLIKLKLKIVFSSANMSTANYLQSLIVGFPPLLITIKLHLQPKVI